MAKWRVYKYVRENGRCPIDEFRSEVTENDAAAMDAKVLTIESVTGQLPPETVKKIGSDTVREVKIRGDKKQLRPLCVVDADKKIILLCAVVKKTTIKKGELTNAENLAKEWKDGKGHVKPYFED